MSSVRAVRDLVGTVEREKALGGVMVVLVTSKGDMLRAAPIHRLASSGLGQFRRIMVKMVEELLCGFHDDGERLPPLSPTEGFRRAPKERGGGAVKQAALFD